MTDPRVTDSAFRVELAIRSAQIAKVALDMLSMHDRLTARMNLVELAKQLRDLDNFLTKTEVSRD